MRLTLTLTLWVLLGVAITLLTSVYLRAEREEDLLESDIKKDHLVLGHALGVDVVEEWRDRGRDAAFSLVSKMNSERATIDLSAYDVVDLSPAVAQHLLDHHRLQTFEGAEEGEHLVTLLPLMRHGKMVAALRLDESLAPARAYVRQTLERTATSALIGLFASAGLAWIFGFLLIGRPVRALVDKARRVGAGDLSGPLPTKRRDELGLLARELNAMCDRLVVARAELERVTEERIAAVQQLRHADRLSTLGLLSAGIAHELGTPLNVVAGRARLISERDGPDSDTGRGAAVIEEQAQRMTRIVRQLLDFARARRPDKMHVEIGRIARDTAEMLGSLASKKQVAIVVGGTGELGTKVDAGQIQQALANLIVNAIHASDTGSTVSVDVLESEGGEGLVTVRDTGRGMDDETMKNIFTPFFTTKDVGEGTGLGLAVAWGLVEENGGRITVTSAKGRGSAFTIHLPGSNE